MKQQIEISDHALIRWLECSHGFNMEGFRQQMLAKLGFTTPPPVNMKVTIDGVQYLIKNGVVVTAIDRRTGRLRNWGSR